MPPAVVNEVNSRVNPECCTESCEDSGCSLSMIEVPTPNVLISLEHEKSPAAKSAPHCDFLFIGDSDTGEVTWIASIELTTGKARASKFLPQLRAGAEIANHLLPPNANVRFRAVAVHGKGGRSFEMNKLRDCKIPFRGKNVRIKLVRCGSPLVKAL